MLSVAHLATALVVIATSAQEDVYAWPLELPRVLTSSFGEYRPGRFHMGIDLRTGPIGKPVRAASDGHVARVRVSPYGYGKAVYLATERGQTAVYAHLSDFFPALREYVRDQQHDREQYTIDLYPDPDLFPVNKGDVIAYSGQTGTGVPHLHYELRDNAGIPLNPRLAGVTWPDDTRPQFRRAVILPMQPQSKIDGDYLPVVLDVAETGRGAYRTNAAQVSGPVAFAVDIIDPADGGALKLGIHTLRAVAAGETVFEMRHDRIGYDDEQDAEVAYHPYLTEHGRFLNLWRWPNNDAEIYARASGAGIVEGIEDDTDIVITALDFQGNEATLTIPLAPDPPETPPETSGEAGTGSVLFDVYGQWLIVTVAFTESEGTTPILLISAADGRTQIFTRVSDRLFRTCVVPKEVDRLMTLNVLHPRAGLDESGERIDFAFLVASRGQPDHHARFGEVEIRVGPNAPYGRLFLSVIEDVLPNVTGFDGTGTSYHVWHPHAPIDDPVRIGIRIPSDAPSGLHIYRQDDESWEWLPTERENGWAYASTRALGRFALLEDNRPPILRDVLPTEGATITVPRPEIRAGILDEQSGIDTFRATLNGNWLLMAYDPEQDALIWERDEDLPAGDAVLEFTVTDKAGHVTTVEQTFTVIEAEAD